MKLLALSMTVLLTGCTIKVVLPEQPIPVHQATLLAGDDPVNNTMRVSVVEPHNLDGESASVKVVGCLYQMEDAMREMEYFLIWRKLDTTLPEAEQWAYVDRQMAMYVALAKVKRDCWSKP